MVLNLDELDNTNNLEDERLSNVLLRYHVTGSEESISFEPVTCQYKKFKNGEFASLTRRGSRNRRGGSSSRNSVSAGGLGAL